ncbi:biopolymer transport protein ExbB [Halopseudomonas sabulinigri]|uniref:Biopolymer transport protein ExbB n=1 Tax=Halopseudomonas sabulinigri TaxID=472181 RepID=A0A1H1RHC8_9GAMM|nr:MotA/TolQ/ExbB proton channel family protein [Halopseudomonas sabulinigri]SDS35100.1 biopolymer transport protein ExbB [Halopseudomonas sabulinigri]
MSTEANSTASDEAVTAASNADPAATTDALSSAAPVTDPTQLPAEPMVNALHDSAVAPTSMLDTVTGWLVVGGPVVWILLAMSVVALSILLIKLWQFNLPRPEGGRAVNRSLSLWHKGDAEGAIAQLNTRQTVPAVLLLAMRGMRNGTDQTLLREELQRVGSYRLNQLKLLLRPLEVIANLAPLLGLLGTVLGMIEAFQQMESAGSRVDPSILSGGIWQALLTTAVGLAVAIPVVAIHSWLERRVERIAASLNDAVTQVFTHQPKPQHSAKVANAA